MPPASATVNAQFWMDAAPWRLTAGWSMLAALLATGGLASLRSLDLRLIVLLWLLVDPMWGALWRLAGGRQSLLPLRGGGESARLRLPYLRPHSPAADLLSLDESNVLPWLVRVALPALVIALLTAAALGLPAVICTALLALVAATGWTLRSTLDVPPLLMHAVAVVALPWTLTYLLIGSPASSTALWSASLALAMLWTVHAWGEARVSVWPGDRLGPILLGAAQLAVALVLIANKAPIGVPILAVLVLPTWLRVARGQSLEGLSFWWTAAMVASAFALGWQ